MDSRSFKMNINSCTKVMLNEEILCYSITFSDGRICSVPDNLSNKDRNRIDFQEENKTLLIVDVSLDPL